MALREFRTSAQKKKEVGSLHIERDGQQECEMHDQSRESSRENQICRGEEQGGGCHQEEQVHGVSEEIIITY
jgi:hypothetical protein